LMGGPASFISYIRTSGYLSRTCFRLQSTPYPPALPPMAATLAGAGKSAAILSRIFAASAYPLCFTVYVTSLQSPASHEPAGPLAPVMGSRQSESTEQAYPWR